MKVRGVLAVLLFLTGLQSALAQTLKLYLSDKQVVEYSVEKVDSLVFTDDTAETHEYVDLGLPSGTLWATCNVGANSPEDWGDYFAWGETEPKNEYSWSTYKYCKGSDDTMTKYCTSSSYGTVDNKTELEAIDDAATVNWGSEWQIPSYKQCRELINSSYTTTTWTTLNGKYGRKITSKSNGNSIFLPAAGYRNGTFLYDAGSHCYYWSRSLSTGYSDYAYELLFGSTFIDTDGNLRRYGQSVRPVRVKNVQTVAVSNIELSQTELSVKVGETTQLSATVLPDNASKKDVKWESSNADVAMVDETGKVVAVAAGTCTIICSAADGSGVKAECQVEVVKNETHEYVDLGLPSGTLWATCNVGANSPEEYGDYFAWGETEPRSDYSYSTYKYCKGTGFTMTKYCTSSDYGTVDNKTELEPSDDAATVNWGSEWQMPSDEQCEELINSSYTTTTYTFMNRKYGRKITSKSNGNSIFFPAAGYRYDTSLYNTGSVGSYWSRSLNTSLSSSAYELFFNSSNIDTKSNFRCYGRSVRPVRVNDVRTVDVSNIELNMTKLSVKVGETRQLSATVLPENATNKAVFWSSSNTNVATVSQTGNVTALTVGTCTITCSATGGSGVKAECKVTVITNDNSGTLDGHEYVDLGLPSGTLWATCNVGANSPEEYGEYFAWGETEPKSNYSWSTYKYCKGSDDTLTKYCTDSRYGTVDNKEELEPSDDAATVNWGSGWQMPSYEQLNELINSSYTTKTWTTMNGVYGRKITSKSNDNSIFLPAAGYRYGASLYHAGSYGYYWSRSLDASYSGGAYGLSFDSSYVRTGVYGGRYDGLSVRPVRVKK